jgi:uncharacterized DUF497 family protein
MGADGDRTIVDAERGVEYDADKDAWTVAQRGISFASAARIWDANSGLTLPGKPQGGELRFKTLGLVDDFPLAVIWTPRDGRRRIISARKASRKERTLL